MPDTIEQSETTAENEAVEPEVTTPTDEGASEPEEAADATDAPSEESSTEEEAEPTGLVAKLKSLPWKWIGGGVGLLMMLTAGYLYMSREPEQTPAEKLKEALVLLKDRKNPNAQKRAGKLARELINIKYRDPHFAGGTEYIVGMLSFRKAQSSDEVDREILLLKASRYLREAEIRALEDERRPDWAYALGVSLYHIGKSTEARPLLEETVEKNPDHQIEAATLLTNVYLDLQEPKLLKQALSLNDQVLASKKLSQTDRDQSYLQRARILLLLDRKDEVEKTLAMVSENASNNQETIVFKARTLMQEKKYQAAFLLLEPIANEVGLEQAITRKAAYFRAVCSEQLGDVDATINLFSRTAKKYLDSHEGVAASLSAGDLLRTVRRDEEALQMYRQALQQVKNRNDFRNRWLTLDQFEKRIKQAWKEWIANYDFTKAIELSRMMTPLFPKSQAYQSEALANQHWAEFIEQELTDLPYKTQLKRKEELKERWQQSGEAYARLAVELRATTQYADALWMSATHFRKGHHFENARKQYVSFLNTRPTGRIAIAHVRMGQTLMDLDLLDDALVQLGKVRANFPTNSAVYEAEYLIGVCYLEKSELKKAESKWRAILTSTELTPAANEWRLSLFALGTMLHHSASMTFTKANRLQDDLTINHDKKNISPESKALYDQSFTQWDEASRRLEEYLDRYPQSPEVPEARFLLAKSAQYYAELPRRKLKTAETENAQKETLRAMQELLTQAKDEFLKLQSQLLVLAEKNRLNNLEERMLHDCYFELAHTYYALKEYDKAVIRYSGAVNRYPRDSQVLLSYIQMANCYENLNKPLEARSMFEQARVILDGMDEKVFDLTKTNMTKTEWKNWLTLMRKLHQKRF